jgi:hypothetical protein
LSLRAGVCYNMADKTNTLSSSPTEVNVQIGDKNDKVVLYFTKSISWLEMEPVVAIKIAEMIKEKAIEILRSEPKP